MSFNADVLLKKLGDPGFLLDCTARFHRIEPKDSVYFVALHYANRFRETGRIQYFLDGAVLLLATWNFAGYKGLERTRPEKLKRKLEEAYRAVRNDLESLQDSSINNVNLGNHKVVNAIVNVFNTFRSIKLILRSGKKRGLGPTGASKVLHLVNPRLFVMFDRRIRSAYHTLHRGHGGQNDVACYLDFLRQMQIAAQRAIEGAGGEEAILEAHRDRMPESSRIVMEALGVEETLAKLLDECNYVAITREALR